MQIRTAGRYLIAEDDQFAVVGSEGTLSSNIAVAAIGVATHYKSNNCLAPPLLWQDDEKERFDGFHLGQPPGILSLWRYPDGTAHTLFTCRMAGDGIPFVERFEKAATVNPLFVPSERLEHTVCFNYEQKQPVIDKVFKSLNPRVRPENTDIVFGMIAYTCYLVATCGYSREEAYTQAVFTFRDRLHPET